VPLSRVTQQSEAVCFLLHWPYLLFEKQAPDVIRHTALRSSDFPPLHNALAETKTRTAAITRPPASSSVAGPLEIKDFDRIAKGLSPRSYSKTVLFSYLFNNSLALFLYP
jgi:hypothetical protein